MKLTQGQIRMLAVAVGMKNPDVMAAIAMAESNEGDTNAHNSVPPDDSYGLWQVNMIGSLGPPRLKEFGISQNSDLLNPLTNALAAKKIEASQGLGAWSTYTSGAYQKYMGKSTAVQASTTAPGAAYSSYVTPSGTTVDLTVAPAGYTQAGWNDLLRVFPPFELWKLVNGSPVPDLNGVPGLGSATSGINGMASSLSGIGASITAGANWLSNPRNWLRVAYVAGGGVLLVGGLMLIVRTSAPVEEAVSTTQSKATEGAM